MAKKPPPIDVVRVVDAKKMKKCCADVIAFLKTIAAYLDDLNSTPVGCVPSETRSYTGNRELALGFNADALQWENSDEYVGAGVLPFQVGTRGIQSDEALYLYYVGIIDASLAAMLILGGNGDSVEPYLGKPNDFYQHFWISGGEL